MEIRVENIVKEENSIVVKFSCSDGLKRFFPLCEFVVEYSVDVADTPDSLAVIPFVCNVLPIVWLTDSTLFLPDFDSAFVQGLPAIKEAYQEMHPSMPFKGSVHTTRITDNINLQNSGSHTAAFFSGGADAFATLIDHATESPMLITLWGADIKLSDTEGWNRVIDHARQTALDFGTESLWIKSNFRSFLNEGELDSLVRSSGDGWWHGFQHGIGLIGHAAPLVWAKGLGTLYIAASRSAGHPGNSPCASVPAIDNNVQMSACRTVHDQYEFDRIDKIKHIVDYVTLINMSISLRTCWLSRGGGNCCRCEKCLRTIGEIYACGGDPVSFGYKFSPQDALASKKRVIVGYAPHLKHYWDDIRERLGQHTEVMLPKGFRWMRSYSFPAGRMPLSVIIRRLPNQLMQFSQRILRRLKRL